MVGFDVCAAVAANRPVKLPYHKVFIRLSSGCPSGSLFRVALDEK